MSKHTPGPWQVGMSGGHNACNICTKEGTTIAVVYGIPLHRSLEELKAEPRHADGEPLANARLIAAAPDLLEALQTYELYADEISEHGHTPVSHALLVAAREKAAAAIKKAEEGL